jgi:ABC1 atypical kinase-like domain
MIHIAASKFMSATMTGAASPHPLLVQTARPLQNQQWSLILPHKSSSSSAAMNSRYYQLVARWKRNFSRLYARRMMDLAIASVAVHRLRTQAEAAVFKPLEWQDWQRKDWDETALASVGQTKFQRFWMAAKRLTNLTILATPMMVLVPLSYVSQRAHVAAWNYALWGIEQAGPTWIKLMQWASTRQDLFSPEFCQHFGKLRDETEGHSWEETKQILEAELGEKGLKALKIEKEPIGSGCIAQVYQGRLLEPALHYPKGTELAIKVQHPGIWSKVCVDFYIFHKVAKFLEELPYLGLEYLSLVDSIRQFRDVMIPQLDLTIESSHLQRFNKNFASNDQITFPRPLEELTTNKVLVETFSDGKPIIEYTKEGTPKPEREQLAKLGLEMTLQMIFCKCCDILKRTKTLCGTNASSLYLPILCSGRHSA